MVLDFFLPDLRNFTIEVLYLVSSEHCFFSIITFLYDVISLNAPSLNVVMYRISLLDVERDQILLVASTLIEHNYYLL